MRRLVLLGVIAVVLRPAAPAGQPSTRKATTVAALGRYSVFFQGQRVRVRAEIREKQEDRWIEGEGPRIFLVPTDNRARPGDVKGSAEILGTFWDVGRLEPEDPRISTALRDLVRRQTTKDWPGRGEILVLLVEDTEAAQPFPAPSVRALALDPERYVDQRVTVSGRFRARNLYGDLPDSPGKGRWDFVIQSADTAIWVTGVRPRGKGFDFNVNERVDTGRWLEVSGLVRYARGLVWVEATDVRAAPPQDEAPEEAPPARPTEGPPPEVVFSTPTQDESDVPQQTTVRIQFSRDMNAETFKGRVRVGYAAQQFADRGELTVPAIGFTYRYSEGNRVLELQFTQPLERFRAVKVELLDGIAARDGAPLKPWMLTFETGGA